MLSPNGGLREVACSNAGIDISLRGPLQHDCSVGRRGPTAAHKVERPPHAVVATSEMKLAPLSPGGSSSKPSTRLLLLMQLYDELSAGAAAVVAAPQIIPANYLTLVPSTPTEYEKVDWYTSADLPWSYESRFVDSDEAKAKYKIVIGGANFGCGSSGKHTPLALRAAGVADVVAQSYVRIFLRNSVATGEVYPLETDAMICEECRMGDTIMLELAESKLINHATRKEYKLKPIADAGPMIVAGGIFAYATKAGMIPPEQLEFLH